MAGAVADKAEFDYKGGEIGQGEAERRIRTARQFLAAVKDILR